MYPARALKSVWVPGWLATKPLREFASKWLNVNFQTLHMESASHRARMRGRSAQLPLSLFCASTTASATPSTSTAPSTSSAPAPQSTASIPATSTQMLCAATSTLQAEVLWCLDLAVKHHSFKSNDNKGELFRMMFPDSQIAKSFALAKDKTGYIIKFGISPYFKKQLVEAINHANPRQPWSSVEVIKLLSCLLKILLQCKLALYCHFF